RVPAWDLETSRASPPPLHEILTSAGAERGPAGGGSQGRKSGVRAPAVFDTGERRALGYPGFFETSFIAARATTDGRIKRVKCGGRRWPTGAGWGSPNFSRTSPSASR